MRFDIEELMGGSRLSPLHWRVLILCALAAFLDGYDVAVMASGDQLQVVVRYGHSSSSIDQAVYRAQW